MGRSLIGIAVILGLAIVGAFLLAGGERSASDPGLASLAYSLALVGLIGSSLFVSFREDLGRNLRALAFFAALFFVLIAGYGYRDEFRAVWGRVSAELSPGQPVESGPQAVTLRRMASGHFEVDAWVNGVAVRFMVDTGASDVVLSKADARRIGLDPERLSYTGLVETANGRAFTAPIRLQDVRIGGIVMTDVAASVVDSDLNSSLLGMSFLNRLDAFGVEGDVLTMRGTPAEL